MPSDKEKHDTKILAVAGKGGVGKTTTVLNLGAALAVNNRRVLLVDCDPQHHLSNWLNWEADGKPTTSDIIFSSVGTNGRSVSIKKKREIRKISCSRV